MTAPWAVGHGHRLAWCRHGQARQIGLYMHDKGTLHVTGLVAQVGLVGRVRMCTFALTAVSGCGLV